MVGTAWSQVTVRMLCALGHQKNLRALMPSLEGASCLGLPGISLLVGVG